MLKYHIVTLSIKEKTMSIEKKDLMYVDPNIENNHLLHINRLDARATIIPAQKRNVYFKNKEESSFLTLLNGDYKFAYHKSDDMPDFYKTEVKDDNWDIIDVPSMWQYRGYGEPTYPNVYYPIPFEPPYVKVENPVGYYRYEFDVNELTPTAILHFCGVDNAYYVYLNGEQIGFAKGSRIPAEFDVSSVLKKGKNLLAVKVFTYSDATYLENQDMLMANGIFRDVYLLQTDETYLWDYRITTTYTSFTINANIKNPTADTQVVMTLDGKEVTLKGEANVTHTFEMQNAKLWNAEEPNLYDLYIEIKKGGKTIETHSKRVGIMHTRTQGNKFLVNDKPIYIKGVNRHETDSKNGRYIDVKRIEEDLLTIKKNNLNSIRLSHYTNNPATYEIAAELGLYLMDEADCETHGAGATGDQGFLSKDPDWEEAITDRTKRMLAINKNETAIFIWSAGNECGQGPNFSKCAEICAEFDPTKVVWRYNSESRGMRGVGYYPMQTVYDIPDETDPVVAIEYAHAMGNSPGLLWDYWDYNYTHEKMAGGFVWEFRTHSMYAEDENGTPYYKYGGDWHGDKEYHWKNFCMDGYITSDGTPKYTWYELGEVSFAGYARYADGKITIKNTNDFTTLDAYKCKYELLQDYTVIRSAYLNLPSIAPHEWYTPSDIDLTVPNIVNGAKYYVNIIFEKDGTCVSKKQFKVDVKADKKPLKTSAFKYELSTENYVLSVKADNFVAKFSNGMLSYYEKDGKVLLDTPISLNAYRAPNDNDGIKAISTWFHRHIDEWNLNGVDLSNWQFGTHNVKLDEYKDKITVQYAGKFRQMTKYRGFACNIIYEIYKDGIIHVSLQAEPYGDLCPVLPRFGFIVPIKKNYDSISWFGRGPKESYCDCVCNAPVGLYESKIENTYTIFDMPQDSGNHENTTFVRTLSNDGVGLCVSGQDEFAFSFHDFTIESLDNAQHKNELKKDPNYNYLYIDYKMRGLGSKSCGPEPEEQYEFRPHTFLFSFVISCSSNDETLELAHTDFGKGTKRLSDTFVYVKPQLPTELLDCNVK